MIVQTTRDPTQTHTYCTSSALLRSPLSITGVVSVAIQFKQGSRAPWIDLPSEHYAPCLLSIHHIGLVSKEESNHCEVEKNWGRVTSLVIPGEPPNGWQGEWQFTGLCWIVENVDEESVYFCSNGSLCALKNIEDTWGVYDSDFEFWVKLSFTLICHPGYMTPVMTTVCERR